MSRQLFITGTGTDVGKTYVTGLILKKLQEHGKNAAYYKAAMSGNERQADGKLIPGDAVCVKTMSGIGQSLEDMCPYVYEAAVSPHLASQIEGNPIEMKHILQAFDRVSSKYDYVTAEGSGGILCPLRFDRQVIRLEDFIKARRLPSLIVADAGLGTINAVVLTAEYMKSRNMAVKGILFNRYDPDDRMHVDNVAMCQHMTGLEVIGCVREGAADLEIPLETLERLYEDTGGTAK